MVSWVIENELARGQRPGYSGEHATRVAQAQVDRWLSEARDFGIKSIICLLADDQLRVYESLPSGLIAYYRDAGFSVEHVPVRDHQSPPLPPDALGKIWAAYQGLPKPVLVHCSAGVDRTGMAVEHIGRMLEPAT